MSKHLINESPLVVLPTLAKKIGLNEAIVLQQVQYWISNPKAGVVYNGHKWVHNTYAEWAENFPFWSESGVKKIILRLESMNLLLSAQTSPNPYDHTKSYRINYENLDEIINHIEFEERVLSERQGFENTPDSAPQVRSPHILLTETTNTASNENRSLPDNLPIEWQIAAGAMAIKTTNEKFAQQVDAANLISMGTGVNRDYYYQISLTFMVERDIIIPQSKIKGQRKAVKEMMETGVTAQNVADAVHKLVDSGMTVTDLYSVAKTAISLANPPETGYNKPEEYHGNIEGV